VSRGDTDVRVAPWRPLPPSEASVVAAKRRAANPANGDDNGNGNNNSNNNVNGNGNGVDGNGNGAVPAFGATLARFVESQCRLDGGGIVDFIADSSRMRKTQRVTAHRVSGSTTAHRIADRDTGDTTAVSGDVGGDDDGDGDGGSSGGSGGSGGRWRLDVESCYATPDAPFGECFRVLEKWSIVDVDVVDDADNEDDDDGGGSGSGGGGGGGACVFRCSVGVFFQKTTWTLLPLRSTVRARIIAEVAAAQVRWATIAITAAVAVASAPGGDDDVDDGDDEAWRLLTAHASTTSTATLMATATTTAMATVKAKATAVRAVPARIQTSAAVVGGVVIGGVGGAVTLTTPLLRDAHDFTFDTSSSPMSLASSSQPMLSPQLTRSSEAPFSSSSSTLATSSTSVRSVAAPGAPPFFVDAVRFYSGGDAAAAAKAVVTSSTRVAPIAMLVVVVAAVCVPQIGAHATVYTVAAVAVAYLLAWIAMLQRQLDARQDASM
jgi:hypothetical protein